VSTGRERKDVVRCPQREKGRCKVSTERERGINVVRFLEEEGIVPLYGRSEKSDVLFVLFLVRSHSGM
jgi:hypothetical protein